MRLKKSKNIAGERESLAFVVERYFNGKKNKISLHFDGHPGDSIKVGGIKIHYSENQTADERIKNEISNTKNAKLITVVTSDSNLSQFAKVCSCNVLSSEEFVKMISSTDEKDLENQKIKELQSDMDEFKKLFEQK